MIVTRDFFLRLYTYNDWANHACLTAAAKLGTADYTRPHGVGWQSVRGILTHIMAADRVWLNRWQGASPSGLEQDEEATPTVEALQAAWDDIMRARRAYLAELTPDDLDGPLEYRNTKGVLYQQPLWELLFHVVNHGSDHRGHVSTLLTGMGSPTVPLDYIAWIRDNPIA